MKRFLFLIAIAMLAGFGAITQIANAQDNPQPVRMTVDKSVQLTDGYIVTYGGRVRLTKGTWDFLKLTLRQTFKVWGHRGDIDGFNLLLDPGYRFPWQSSPRTAGPVRTTAYSPNIQWFENATRWNDTGGNVLNTCNIPLIGACTYANAFFACGNYADQVTSRKMQKTGGGCVGPDVFSVVDESVAGSCYKQYQFCSTGTSPDPGSGGSCTQAPLTAGDTTFGFAAQYNARIYIYPNMYLENQNDPSGQTPFQASRWPYTGMYRGGLVDTVGCESTLSIKGCDWSSSGSGCDLLRCGTSWNGCCSTITWPDIPPFCVCSGCRSWSWGVCTGCRGNCGTTCVGCLVTNCCSWPLGCNGSSLNQYSRYYWYSNNYPVNATWGDGAFNQTDGLYFRSGDDTALYVNVNRMQLHSSDRVGGSVAGAGIANDDCGYDQIYTTTGYQPQKVRKCMRPWMYWRTTPLPAKWVQCDPFDTWYSDGSYNPGNDDAKRIYPGFAGNPVCGAQACTGIYCANPPATRRTTNLNDVANPGGGWYGLKVENLWLQQSDNTINISLRADQLRIEMGFYADIYATLYVFGGAINMNFTGKSSTGLVSADWLTATAHVKLYSVDNSLVDPDINDLLTNPDKLIIDVQMGASDMNIQLAATPFIGISSPSGYSTSANCLAYVQQIKFCFLDLVSLINFVLPIVKGEIIKALVPALQGALASISTVVPDLNGIMGDPWKINTALIDVGLYATGAAAEADNSTSPARYPLKIKDGPFGAGGGRQIADLTMAIGFKPIAFVESPPGTLTINTSAAPPASAVFGVPTIYDQDTMACTYCVTPKHPKRKDADQAFDLDDWYTVPPAPQKIVRAETLGLPWVQAPPTWCISPRQLRTTQNLNAFYPKATWLSFDAWEGTARNSKGTWDTVDTMRQNQSDINNLENKTYDVSVHMHQRVLAEFAAAVLASGAACIEFAEKDTMGVDTPWKDFLRLDRFAAFLPELTSLFPKDSYIKVQFIPMQNPRFRMGLGSLSYTPSNINNIPITAQPYTMGIAAPDLRIKFIVQDSRGGPDVPFFELKWNAVFGLYLKAIRQCHWLDPLVSQPECQSLINSLRTISGYYEMFVDMNSSSSPTSLAQSFEQPGNAIDGFVKGTFSRNEMYCTGVGCAAPTPAGESARFEVISTYCGIAPTKCKKVSLSQAVPTLMGSYLSLFLATRLQFYGLSLDFLYVGPDGPNEDGVGGGDYFGAYLSFLGKLDVFSLINQLTGLLAPGEKPYPDTGIKLLETAATPGEQPWLRENRASFNFQGTVPPSADVGSQVSYTYRVDSGFWHTPVAAGAGIDSLTEGAHSIEVRAITDEPGRAYIDPTPAKFSFRVDSVAPSLKLNKQANRIMVQAEDLQTPAEQLQLAYRVDGGDDESLAPGDSISTRFLKGGKHSILVSARDAAGNVATATEIIDMPGGSGWGCASGSSDGANNAWLVGSVLLLLALRRKVMARRVGAAAVR